MRSPFLRLFGALALLTLAVALASTHLPKVWAHASYVSSNPTDKQVLASGPSQLTITFVSNIVHGNGTFASVTSGSTDAVASPGAPSSTDPKTLVVPLKPNLPNGKYIVFWKSTDADDGGVTFGRFSFFIGNASPADVAAADPGVSIAVPDDATAAALDPVGSSAAKTTGAENCGADSWCAYCANHATAMACPKSGS